MSTRALEITDLTYQYPNGTLALDKLSLAVEANERVAIIGANGAGKSTLLLHLTGVLRASSSSAFKVFGTELSKKTLREIRQRVGMVFQNPDDQLFCPSVHEDVAFGPRNLKLPESEVLKKVEESLAAVGLPDHGSRSAFQLSLGQKKRAAIATVLAMDCQMLALDEPTSALDPRGRREIMELLEQLGGTQLIITHDFALAQRLCSRAIILHNGRKVADGDPANLLNDEALLDAHDLL
ncbi:MAG: ABC transporter ATP-binding protein [Planctomycetota bacterium]|nr:ABC transporter ATP-binding protein [Planctomycetota bacterium]